MPSGIKAEALVLLSWAWRLEVAPSVGGGRLTERLSAADTGDPGSRRQDVGEVLPKSCTSFKKQDQEAHGEHCAEASCKMQAPAICKGARHRLGSLVRSKGRARVVRARARNLSAASWKSAAIKGGCCRNLRAKPNEELI